jgi:tetratricopeptide (TPR) repeat protein
LFVAERADGADPGANVLLLAAIARFWVGEVGIEAFDERLIRAAGKGADLRKLLIAPLAQRGRLDDAVRAQALLIATLPPALSERRWQSGLLARAGRWDEAIAMVDALAADQPDEVGHATARIQYRLSAGRVAEAAALVRAMKQLPVCNRLTNVMLMTLFRQRDYASAIALVDRIDLDKVDDSGLAGNIVQALFRGDRFEDAIVAGERYVDWALDSPVLRNHLAQAWYRGRSGPERLNHAIDHLEVGVAQQPDNIRMISMLGDLLLRSGKHERALPYLARSCELQPGLAQVRTLYARALKQAGHYDQAADQFAMMVATATDRGGRWQRLAAGALSQAGRRDEATAMFDSWVASRALKLPSGFGEGLEALWDKIDTVNIPMARLDWAWGLRSPDCTLDRTEWERRAKWGNLADHHLLDWLECRDEQVEEAMHFFSDELDCLDAFLMESRARALGKGTIIASAHIGAMYFGPLALELIGERSRWIASTPSIARTSYAESLISTSDQTDAQVVRASMQALKEDYCLVIAVDGAINLAAPRVMFEGQEVTFSQFAARMAHRLGSPSAFIAPIWRDDNRLGFVLEHLPMPKEGESADTYAERWQEAYFAHLRRFLTGKPENLRLSGGIWRYIDQAQRG